MGYRSKVVIVFYKKDYEKLFRKFIKLADKIPNLLREAELRYFRYNNKDYAYLCWSSVNWYEYYDEICLIDEFIRTCDHVFARIGENVDDIEYSVVGDDFSEFVEIRSSIIIKDFVLLGRENEKKKEKVYIVTRKYDDYILTQFVYKNYEDAMKCAKRLKEMYPLEEICLESYIVREEYK